MVRPASKFAQLRAVGGRKGMGACAMRSCRFHPESRAFRTALTQGQIENAASRAIPHRNPKGPQSLCIRTVVFCLLRQPWHSRAKPSLFALFDSGGIPGGSRLLGDRSLLSFQSSYRPHLRTAPALPEGTARRDLFPDVRRAHVLSRTLRGFECMPIRLGNTRSCKSCVLPQSELVPEGGSAVFYPGAGSGRPRSV